ncbi:MAG: hypothetical protein H6R10_712 [Rhodocyclaceae bacterium]|nr:hypothetical protein [Rhodocyclaceae bacterium]
MSAHLNHDTAARLLDLTPGELTRLVNAGIIPRVGKDAYALAPIVHSYIGHLRDEQARADQRPTQAEIAAHLDISDRRLRELLTEFGLDHKQVPLSDIRIKYIRKLREEAAGRAAGGDLDLAGERALLARAQREGQEIKNEVARGTYAPIELLSDVLANASQAVVDRMDQIPAALRRVCPDLPQAARDAIMAEIASARNEMVRKTASLVADTLEPTDVQEEDEFLVETPEE